MLQALLPALLHASAARGHSTEICSVYGIKQVVLPDAASAQQHCQVCMVAQMPSHSGPAVGSFIPLALVFPIPVAVDHGFHPWPSRSLHLRGPPPLA
jgi:hypothetical protein